MRAFTTTAPLWSVAVPRSVDTVNCAHRFTEKMNPAKTTRRNIRPGTTTPLMNLGGIVAELARDAQGAIGSVFVNLRQFGASDIGRRGTQINAERGVRARAAIVTRCRGISLPGPSQGGPEPVP